MSEKQDKSTQLQQNIQSAEKPAWYDSLIKIVQDLLNFNMLVYKKEKAQRL